MLLANLIYSVIIQALQFLAAYVIAVSLGIHLRMLYFFIFIPIISALSTLPISIGGLGVRDVTTILLFSKVGLSKELGFAMSLANNIFVFILGVIGGLVYVLTLHHRRL